MKVLLDKALEVCFQWEFPLFFVEESIQSNMGILQREKKYSIFLIDLSIYFRTRPGVDFAEIFTSSFYACSSQKHKNSVKLSISFTLLGSTGAKAASRTLMKLTPGCQSGKKERK